MNTKKTAATILCILVLGWHAPALADGPPPPAERSVSSLMWFADGMLYQLQTSGVDERSRAALLEIARRLSK